MSFENTSTPSYTCEVCNASLTYEEVIIPSIDEVDETGDYSNFGFYCKACYRNKKISDIIKE